MKGKEKHYNDEDYEELIGALSGEFRVFGFSHGEIRTTARSRLKNDSALEQYMRNKFEDENPENKLDKDVRSMI